MRSGIRRLSALMVTRGALIALALVGVVLILVTPAHARVQPYGINDAGVGAVSQPLIEWINRPTFQQAVEIQSHGSR